MVKETSSTSSTTIKKKRKTGNQQENDGEVDIYKKVVDFEEKEAKSRDSNQDAEIYYTIVNEIRESLGEILKLKSDTSVEACTKKTELFTEACVRIAIIKKLNRIDKIQHVFGKDTITVEKQKCDSIKLGFQNLVYELHHLMSEINKCKAFKSRDENIELVPLEEFMSNAPENITKKFRKFNENSNEEKHALRLARLEYELQQRKSLAELYESLLEEKKKLQEDIKERKDRLNGLLPLLMNVLNATKPLQEHLNIPIDQIRAEHQLAYLLPDPLYIFYSNVVSYKAVFDINLKAVINGDQEEAGQWKQAQLIAEDDESDQDDYQEVEEIVEVKKRRHRKSVQVDPMEEKKRKLLEVHPLSVDVIMGTKDGSIITITMHYYTRLKIVTASSKVDLPTRITGFSAREILSGENILAALFPNDTGMKSPNPNTLYQLKKVGMGSFSSLIPQIGYPYEWAQKVCGIDFLNKSTSSEELGHLNVEITLKTLNKRLIARNELATELQQLEQNNIPPLPSTFEMPKNIISSIMKWSLITYQKFCECSFTQPLVEEDLIDPADMFYSVTITRSTATLQGFIVIKNTYPVDPPMFALSLNYNGIYNSANSDDLRDMERLINVEFAQTYARKLCLLSAQVTLLCSYLDIYLETDDPKAFPQNSMFLKSICARNRRKPFKFRKVGTGIFTQY